MSTYKTPNYRERGSAALILILILLFIIIGIVGWLVFRGHHKSSLPITNTPLTVTNTGTSTYTIDAPSMEPTLKIGDKVTVVPGSTNIQTNDIIAFTTQSNQMLIKRVVAVAGDHVIIKNGTLLVMNADHPAGFDPALTYEASGMTTPGDVDLTVPSGSFYVLGDNRTNSLDSRSLGLIPQTKIIGKIQL